MVKVGKYYACLESDIARIWYITKVEDNPDYDIKKQGSVYTLIEGILVCVYIDGELRIYNEKMDVETANDLEDMGEEIGEERPLEDADTKQEIFEMIFWSWE